MAFCGEITISVPLWNALLTYCASCPCIDGELRLRLQEHEVSNAPLSFGALDNTKLKPPKRHAAKESFPRRVPTVMEWRRRQAELVGDATSYESLIHSFTKQHAHPSFRAPTGDGIHSQLDLISMGRYLAMLTDTSLVNLERQKSFAYFQTLLFFSYCGFLERKGVSADEVDAVAQLVTSIRKMDRTRLRRQALRINRLISNLVGGGWTMYNATPSLLPGRSLGSISGCQAQH